MADETKPLTLRERVAQAKDLRREQVPCPEWGMPTELYVRTLTGIERDEYETSLMPEEGESAKDRWRNIRARLVALSTVDEDGQQVFEPADVEWLGGKSAAPLDRLFEVAQRLSGISKRDVEELAGNSSSDPPDS